MIIDASIKPITPGAFYDEVVGELGKEFGKECLTNAVLPRLGFCYFPSNSHCNFFVIPDMNLNESITGELVCSIDCHIANVTIAADEIINFAKVSAGMAPHQGSQT